MSTDKVLEERGATHGDFLENATISQIFCEVLRGASKWEEMTTVEREALEMIAHKMARIVCGVSCIDHWRDVQGYAKLAENFLATQPGTVDVQTTKLQLNAAKKWVKV